LLRAARASPPFATSKRHPGGPSSRWGAAALPQEVLPGRLPYLFRQGGLRGSNSRPIEAAPLAATRRLAQAPKLLPSPNEVTGGDVWACFGRAPSKTEATGALLPLAFFTASQISNHLVSLAHGRVHFHHLPAQRRKLPEMDVFGPPGGVSSRWSCTQQHRRGKILTPPTSSTSSRLALKTRRPSTLQTDESQRKGDLNGGLHTAARRERTNKAHSPPPPQHRLYLVH
jgi:hypothetical protein